MANNPNAADNLKPAQPGEVRNPNGRPKGVPNSKTRLLKMLTLTEHINNPVTGQLEEFSIIEQLDMKIIAKARNGDIKAYKEILDRLEGTPNNRTELTGADGAPLNFDSGSVGAKIDKALEELKNARGARSSQDISAEPVQE